jgi:hypothetical protein
MRKLTCHCDQVFNVDIPDTFNLDDNPEVIAQIADGSFLSCVCPTCEAELHTDLKTRLDWPSKKASIVLIPEIDRFAYSTGMIPSETDAQVVIGFAELADRVAALQENLDPVAVETIKYHLIEKALESVPDAKITILFERRTDAGELEFHIHGIREGEVAVTKVPESLYNSIAADSKDHPDKDPYPLLKNGTYVSVKNILFEDDQNE